MYFAPQLRALFRHLNFQKWSEPFVFYILTCKCASRHNRVHFFDISTSRSDPRMVWVYILTSKFASRHNRVHFFDISTSRSDPRMVWVYMLTWKCASRHNSVQLVISHPARWLRTRTLASLLTQIIGKTLFRNFPTFSRTCIFCFLILSLLWSSLFCSSLLWLFPPPLFHLSLVSEVWLLNFLRL